MATGILAYRFIKGHSIAVLLHICFKYTKYIFNIRCVGITCMTLSVRQIGSATVLIRIWRAVHATPGSDRKLPILMR